MAVFPGLHVHHRHLAGTIRYCHRLYLPDQQHQQGGTHEKDKQYMEVMQLRIEDKLGERIDQYKKAQSYLGRDGGNLFSYEPNDQNRKNRDTEKTGCFLYIRVKAALKEHNEGGDTDAHQGYYYLEPFAGTKKVTLICFFIFCPFPGCVQVHDKQGSGAVEACVKGAQGSPEYNGSNEPRPEGRHDVPHQPGENGCRILHMYI